MNKKTQGYTLVVVLGSVLLVAGMATMTLSLSMSEITQAGGNQNVARARAAAEAGQSDTLFYMTNQGLSDANATLTPYANAFSLVPGADATVQPIIPANQYNAVISSLNTKAGTSITGTVNGVAYTSKVTYVDMDVDEKTFSVGGQTYILNYTISAAGTFGSYVRQVKTNGQMQIRLGRKYLNQFVLLANDGGSQEGNFFADGMNYDGPVQVNKNWRFAGKPQFRYGATTAAATVQMSQTCDPSTNAMTNVTTQSYGCTAPDWGGAGLKYSAPTIDLPTSAVSQQQSALGIWPSDPSKSISNGQECAALNVTPCSSTGVPNGVYVPSNSGNVAGGIYIKGDANKIVLSVNGDTQIYTITDANNIITTISVNYTTNKTTIVKGTTTTVLNGVLSGESKAAKQPNGMIYSTGSVLSLGGPPRTSTPLVNPVPEIPNQATVPPAVESNSVINIAAAGSVKVQSDLTYEQDPRSVPSAKNVLGLMAGTGSVSIGTNAPNDVYLQAALLAGAKDQGFAVDNYSGRALSGQIHLLGSLAEDKEPPRGVARLVSGKIVMSTGYGDAFNFDPRFLNGASVPPFYPATTKFAAQAVWPSQQGWKEQ